MHIKFVGTFSLVHTIAYTILFAVSLFASTTAGKNHNPIAFSDLSQHPIYSKYKFTKGDTIVNFGTQPLYLPTGLITEAMRRDKILYKSLSELGIQINFYPLLKGDDINFFLKQGNLDAGIGGDMPAITAAATLDIVIPSLIQQGFTSIVANRSILIENLKNKPVGYAFGSNAHYALLNAFLSEGLTEQQILLIPMDTTEMPDALHSGRILAFSAWEPTPTITLNKYPESVIIHRTLSSGFLYFLRSITERNPEIIHHILAAKIRAINWIQSSREHLLLTSKWALDAARELSDSDISISIEENAELAKKDILRFSSAPIIPENELTRNGSLFREFEFLQNINIIPPTIEWKRVYESFDRRIIIDVLTNPEKFQFHEFQYSSIAINN
ncbi:MAG: hypothetical protein FJ264_05045 [Planctomycetes bacterium]|nr:hypothetical protein [Planctomycetota bacterium]